MVRGIDDVEHYKHKGFSCKSKVELENGICYTDGYGTDTENQFY
jgi:hypothetical protein